MTTNNRRANRFGVLLGLFLLMASPLATSAAAAQNKATTTVAYVSTSNTNTGKINASRETFSSLSAALAAGATELRIAPGVYEEAVFAFSGGGTVTLRAWHQMELGNAIELRGTVRIDGGTTVLLEANSTSILLRGDLLLPDGTLDLRGHTLTIDATKVVVGARSHLIDSTYDPAVADCGGFISYIGPDNTDVFLESIETRLRFDIPSQMVNKTGSGKVSFDMTGIPADNLAPNPPNNIDALGMPCFRVTDASPGQRAELLDGLDLFDVMEEYTQLDGTVAMAGVSSPTGLQPTMQEVRVAFNFVEEDGNFFASGGRVTVGGDFLLGRDAASKASDARFDLGGGHHAVTGTLRVAPDTDPCTGEQPVDGDACFGAATPKDDERRNRYFLGGGTLDLFGPFSFLGTGDNFDDDNFARAAQGLNGTVFFRSDMPQEVRHRQDEDAFLNNVTLSGDGGIALLDHAWQNNSGVLTLELGVIDPGEPAYDWILLNPAFEPDLAGRNNSGRGMGVVDLGSRDSYVAGYNQRAVAFGNATGGVITGGYLFPVGTTGEIRLEGGQEVDVNLFRPLILQFPDDLGRTELARVDYRDDLRNADCPLPAQDLVVDDVSGGRLTLNVLGNQFWQLEFDRIPSFDPNIRVQAEELPNILDIKKLRLVQWDCDCTNPRLAGTYDLDAGPTDDASAVVNDFINDVPNLTQEGVDVEACNIIGIASDIFINRIDLRFLDPDLTPVQIVNATPRAADVYVDDEQLLDDLGAQGATPFGVLSANASTLDVTDADAADNSAPLFSTPLALGDTPGLAVLASGADGAFMLFFKDDVRREASTAEKVELLMANTFTGANAVDVILTDLQNLENPVLLPGLQPGAFSDYQTITPLTYTITVSDPATGEALSVFSIDLSDYADEVLTMVLADTPPGKADGLSLLVFDANGQALETADVTATDAAADVPETFALHGNYPNPFNPTTTVAFDLPEPADVSIDVFDVLGRVVMTTPARRVEAGASRTLEIDASALASGTYLYRIVMQGETHTQGQTGRMVLAK